MANLTYLEGKCNSLTNWRHESFLSARAKLRKQNACAAIENVLLRKRGENRRFSVADPGEFVDAGLVTFEFESFAQRLDGVMLLPGGYVDASELIVVIRIVGLGLERLSAKSHCFLELATLLCQAIGQFGFDPRSRVLCQGCFELQQGHQCVAVIERPLTFSK